MHALHGRNLLSHSRGNSAPRRGRVGEGYPPRVGLPHHLAAFAAPQERAYESVDSHCFQSFSARASTVVWG